MASGFVICIPIKVDCLHFLQLFEIKGSSILDAEGKKKNAGQM